MLATLGALAIEWLTGVTWKDAGKWLTGVTWKDAGKKTTESRSTITLFTTIPFISALTYNEWRNAELDPEKRLYLGGKFFYPLGLATNPEKKATLQLAEIKHARLYEKLLYLYPYCKNCNLAEIKHARLAMVAFLGFSVQAAITGKGPLNNWATHLSDPLHTTIVDNFFS
ncbi:unnamed protein product [Ilex paraguariensis]|uniref:Chlorophyll a-b binding protein, chloroplastic n=1 Tax=Ilex paraguariensis TaxID=185542 RepID=A0ABC8SJS2_9AQUA